MLGICLGGQVLARALGAEAYPAERLEAGWTPRRGDAGGRRRPAAGASARAGRRLPVALSTSSTCRRAPCASRAARCSENQAFRYGDRWWGLQFHPEVDAPLFAGWMQNYADAPARNGIDREELEAAIAAGSPRLHGAPVRRVLRRLQRHRRRAARKRTWARRRGAASWRAAAFFAVACLVAAARLASSAAMRSSTRAAGSGTSCSTISRPSALACTSVEHALAVGVRVALGIPVGRERADQLLGDRELLRRRPRRRLGELLDGGARHDLVGEQHRREHQRVLRGPDRREVLLRAQHDAAEPDARGALERRQQQGVRLGRGAVGRQVVGRLPVDRVDVVERDELLDLDAPRALRGDALELGGRDRHVARRARSRSP